MIRSSYGLVDNDQGKSHCEITLSFDPPDD